MAAPLRLLLASATLPIASAWATQPLADPTLPPQAAAVAPAGAAPTPALQFTLRGPDDTISALLAGSWVRAGDSFELNGTTFRVERVTSTSVWLRRGERREVLEMLPQAAQAVRCRGAETRRSCR